MWVAHTVESEVPLHRFLVDLVAALIFFIMNPSFTNFLDGAYRERLDLLLMALGTFFLMAPLDGQVANWAAVGKGKHSQVTVMSEITTSVVNVKGKWLILTISEPACFDK
ncbi:MAG: hypothetical protein ACXVCM_08660, partial [Ktedonobacteraceae bacterium]